MSKFPFIRQLDSMDCGPACLRMIAKYYGKDIGSTFTNRLSNLSRIGTSLGNLAKALEELGFYSICVKVDYEALLKEKPLPAIVHWDNGHFIIIHKITKKKVFVCDPLLGRLSYEKSHFLKNWADYQGEGLVLLMEPTGRFYKLEESKEKVSFKYFFRFLNPFKKLLIQLFLGLIAGSILSLIAPFLTQALVDIGIQNKDINFVYLILLAQLMLFIGTASNGIIRSWILLHISSRLQISVISDFLIKLMKLPIGFFDKKNLGDILQRINDHDRLKQFLTSSTLQSIFSIITILIFGVVLGYYSIIIFLIYFGASCFYVLWVLLFLKQRRIIDHERFKQESAINNNQVQLIQAMAEIKLNQAEQLKRWEWERIQMTLFKTKIKTLNLEQYQIVGGTLINETKNIFIMFYAATQVIQGNMTLGMMMAATQIMGQLNIPFRQLIGFIQEAQDAQISLDRLAEVHNTQEEDFEIKIQNDQIKTIKKGDIRLKNVSFKYGGKGFPLVLKNLNLTIPMHKTTAIVGVSGSGKTTLLKLLLKFYEPTKGKIYIGNNKLSQILSHDWRSNIGVVMQESFLFSESILNNIVMADDKVNLDRFNKTLNITNLDDFVYSLPSSYNTQVGMEGISLSAGQKQRLMIARAIYRDPEFIFLDEATSSLDTTNEKEITERIQNSNRNKTTLIIAHRLSTVKNADKIILLEKGEIKEEGTHRELIKLEGKYYDLIKNQLDLK